MSGLTLHVAGDRLLDRPTWVVLVKLRAEGACERCGSQEDLVAHHQDHDADNHRLDNGELLCRVCHVVHHRTGVQHTPEARARISASLKATGHRPPLGSNQTPEARAKISAANRARGPLSEEHRAAISASRKGQKLSPEHRAKIGASLRARSDETREVARVATDD